MSDAEHHDTGFLSRWSERKLQSQSGQDPPESEDVLDVAENGELSVAPPGEETERVLTDADMPSLESLDAYSDYSGFLSRGVSETLRREALTKLFRSAHLNLVDGLDDYAEDFTQFTPLGEVITADMRHRMTQAAKRLLDGEDSAETDASRAGEITTEPAQVPPVETPADVDEDPAEGEMV